MFVDEGGASGGDGDGAAATAAAAPAIVAGAAAAAGSLGGSSNLELFWVVLGVELEPPTLGLVSSTARMT